MNEIINMLLRRRSIRKYKSEQIEDDDLNLILAAGKYAPSGMNSQSSLFVVIQNKEVIAKITKMNADIFGRDMDPYYGAPTIVIVLADKTKLTHVEDASLAIGNMSNAAFSLGVGSCWIHREKEMFESKEGKELLKQWGIGENYVGVGSLTLGYMDGELPKPSPRKENFVVMVK